MVNQTSFLKLAQVIKIQTFGSNPAVHATDRTLSEDVHCRSGLRHNSKQHYCSHWHQMQRKQSHIYCATVCSSNGSHPHGRHPYGTGGHAPNIWTRGTLSWMSLQYL